MESLKKVYIYIKLITNKNNSKWLKICLIFCKIFHLGVYLDIKNFYIFVFVKMKKLTVSLVGLAGILTLGGITWREFSPQQEKVILYDIIEDS
jgi:hypothetical protein